MNIRAVDDYYKLARIDFGAIQFVYEGSSGGVRLDRAYITRDRRITPQYFYQT